MDDQVLNRFLTAVDKLATISAASNERLATLEANNITMQSAINELVKSQQNLNDSMATIANTAVKIEGDMVRLEEKSLDRISDLQKAQEKLDDRVAHIDGRVYITELAQAEFETTKSNVSKLQADVLDIKLRDASEDGENKVRNFFINNWFNIVKLVIMIGTAIGAGIYMYKSMGSPTI